MAGTPALVSGSLRRTAADHDASEQSFATLPFREAPQVQGCLHGGDTPGPP